MRLTLLSFTTARSRQAAHCRAIAAVSSSSPHVPYWARESDEALSAKAAAAAPPARVHAAAAALTAAVIAVYSVASLPITVWPPESKVWRVSTLTFRYLVRCIETKRGYGLLVSAARCEEAIEVYSCVL